MIQQFINWLKSLFGKSATPIQPLPPTPPAKPSPPPIVHTGPAPGETNGKIYGPDLSHYEPGADWAAVASDNAFGITKATEGMSNVDPLFSVYKKAMIASLEVCGFYHFFHPSQDPIAQAKHFLEVVGPLRQYDFVALDWEVTDGLSPATQQSAARQFLEYVHQQTGKLPWLYSDKGFFEENIQLPEFAKYNIWMAELSPTLMPPPQFKNVALWQYTFTGKYKGVPHPCDGNVFNGSSEELKLLISKTV